LKELHRLFKSKLKFPAFYGMNWDAFWDSITGLVLMPDELEIIELELFSKAFPKDAQIFLECLNDYNTQSDLKELKIVIDK
jgi:RNAse (barnase) inhibitor barstar